MNKKALLRCFLKRVLLLTLLCQCEWLLQRLLEWECLLDWGATKIKNLRRKKNDFTAESKDMSIMWQHMRIITMEYWYKLFWMLISSNVLPTQIFLAHMHTGGV